VNKSLPVEWVSAAGRKMFESENACKKTVNLACLSVIWAIKDGSGVQDSEAVQGISTQDPFLRCVCLATPKDVLFGCAKHSQVISSYYLTVLTPYLYHRDIDSCLADD
jgi:hypothetical protein